MIPPTLLKEAEAAAMEYHPSDRHFMAGVHWLFTRLLEMSEKGFDEHADYILQIADDADIEALKTGGPRRLVEFGAQEGARHQHALSQAALLKAQAQTVGQAFLIANMDNEIKDLTERGIRNSTAAGEYSLQFEAERARCERMERLLQAIERRAGSASAKSALTDALEVAEWARQALSGDAE